MSVMKNKNLLKLLMIVVIAFVGVFVSVSVSADSNEDDDKNYSFYKVGSAAAAFYDEANNPLAGTNGLVKWFQDKTGYTERVNAVMTKIDVTEAGGFLGFIDENYGKGMFGAITSYLSSSSQSKGYQTFEKASNGLASGAYQYVVYGHALDTIGFDTLAVDSFDFSKIGRMVTGAILYLGYIGAVAVDGLFDVILGILQTLNPFRWFANASSMAKGAGISMPGAAGGALSGITVLVSNLYDALVSLSWIIVPVFLAILAVSILLFRKTNDLSSQLRKYATRIFFIVLGIPLLGSAYTATLDVLKNNVSGATAGTHANYILGSTLIDFQGWASDRQLAMPSGVNLKVDIKNNSAGNVDFSSVNLRSFAAAVNRYGKSALLPSDTNVSLDNKDGIEWNSNVYGSTDKDAGSSIGAALDLLGRYTTGALYQSSDFETEYKADKKGKGQGKELFEEIESFTDINKYSQLEFWAGIGGADENSNPLTASNLFKGSGNGLQAVLNGSGTTPVDPNAKDTSTVTLTYKGSGGATARGLSAMSMYNYLNTEFGNSGMTIYSPNKATSGMVKKSHHSVNIIGGSIMLSGLYFFNAAVMFFVITVIGFGYGIGMLVGGLRHGIRIVMTTPMALLGSLKAMSKFTMLVLMMIIGLIGTFFMYGIVIELLMSLNAVVEIPLSAGFQKLGLFKDSPNAIIALISISLGVATIFNIWFLFMALKMRKTFIKSIEEVFAGLIDKLFMSDGASSSLAQTRQPGKLGQLAKAGAGAAITGAGMAAGGPVAGAITKGVGDKVLNKKGDSPEAGESAESGGASNVSGGPDELEIGGFGKDEAKNLLDSSTLLVMDTQVDDSKFKKVLKDIDNDSDTGNKGRQVKHRRVIEVDEATVEKGIQDAQAKGASLVKNKDGSRTLIQRGTKKIDGKEVPIEKRTTISNKKGANGGNVVVEDILLSSNAANEKPISTDKNDVKTVSADEVKKEQKPSQDGKKKKKKKLKK